MRTEHLVARTGVALLAAMIGISRGGRTTNIHAICNLFGRTSHSG